MVTFVALPPKVFPVTVTGVVPHVVPAVSLRVITGGLRHPHEIAKIPVSVVQPSGFLTAKKWLPFATEGKIGLDW
jgi:hypothetical protein